MSDPSPKSLATTLQVLIDIVRLRRGPEDLPFNRSLLVGSIVAFGVLNVGIGQLLPDRGLSPLALVLVEIAVTLAALRFMLQLAKRPERFVQTATAMFGFRLVLLPVQLLVAWLSLRFDDGSSLQAPVLLLSLAVMVWSLVITMRILRSATGWPTIVCVVMMFSIYMLASVLLMLMFPQAFTGASQS